MSICILISEKTIFQMFFRIVGDIWQKHLILAKYYSMIRKLKKHVKWNAVHLRSGVLATVKSGLFNMFHNVSCISGALQRTLEC